MELNTEHLESHNVAAYRFASRFPLTAATSIHSDLCHLSLVSRSFRGRCIRCSKSHILWIHIFRFSASPRPYRETATLIDFIWIGIGGESKVKRDSVFGWTACRWINFYERRCAALPHRQWQVFFTSLRLKCRRLNQSIRCCIWKWRTSEMLQIVSRVIGWRPTPNRMHLVHHPNFNFDLRWKTTTTTFQYTNDTRVQFVATFSDEWFSVMQQQHYEASSLPSQQSHREREREGDNYVNRNSKLRHPILRHPYYQSTSASIAIARAQQWGNAREENESVDRLCMQINFILCAIWGEGGVTHAQRTAHAPAHKTWSICTSCTPNRMLRRRKKC